MHLNTAVSALMELVNELYAFCGRPGCALIGRDADDAGRRSGSRSGRRPSRCVKEAVEALVLMLSPFAPHMAEELWERLGHAGGVVAAGWPAYDEAVARAEEIVVPVQVNGKVRGRADRAPRTRPTTSCASWRSPIRRWRSYLDGKTITKVVVANGKLVVSVVID